MSSTLPLTPPTASKVRLKLESIQVLRGIAASLVVFHHFAQTINMLCHDGLFHQASWIFASGLGNLGASGVDLFFVISGFIMVCTTDGNAGPKAAIRFLKKRSLRIYPLYWFWSSVFVLLIALRLAQHPLCNSTQSILVSYSLFPYFNGTNFQPLLAQGWTLSFELLFYLLFAISISFGFRKFRLPFLLIAFAALAAIGFALPAGSPLRYLFTDPILIGFLLGVIAGELYLKANAVGFHLSRPLAAAIICMGCVALLASTLVTVTEQYRAFFWSIPGFFLVVGSILYRAKSAPRFLVFLGDASYSIYLAHAFFFNSLPTLIRHFHSLQSLNPDLEIALFGSFTILATASTYLFIERPLKDLVHRLIP